MLWQVILHGRQVHFQHSYSLLELAFSPKKPRCALHFECALYFKCYFCALYKGINIQELLITNTNLFIRIHAFSGRFNDVTTRSCFSVVAVGRLLPTRKVWALYYKIMMTDFHSIVFIPKMSTLHSSECFGFFLSFHGNTDFTKNVRRLEISHNFRRMIWNKMGWKSNRNKGQNHIYYLAINEWG